MRKLHRLHTRITVSFWAVLCTLGLLLLSPMETTGQSRVELIPFFASYFPIGSLMDERSPRPGGITAIDRKDAQATAAAVGAKLRVTLSPRIGVEGAFAYVNSRLIIEQDAELAAANVVNTQSSHLLIPSARLIYTPRASNFFGTVGMSYVMRRGLAWSSRFTPDRNRPAGVIGFGAQAPVARNLTISVGVEAHLYTIDADGQEVCDGEPPLCYASTFQQDVLVTIAVPIKLFQR